MIVTTEGHRHICLIDGHTFVWDKNCHESPTHHRWATDEPEFCDMHVEGIAKTFGEQAGTIRDLYLRIARLSAAVQRLYEAPTAAAPAAQEGAR